MCSSLYLFKLQKLNIQPLPHSHVITIWHFNQKPFYMHCLSVVLVSFINNESTFLFRKFNKLFLLQMTKILAYSFFHTGYMLYPMTNFEILTRKIHIRSCVTPSSRSKERYLYYLLRPSP